jgi:iron complex transport system permease protein
VIRLLLALTLLLATLVAGSLAFGDVSLTWQELYQALTRTRDLDPQSAMIVFDLRLPRVLLAALVGVALAIAGTITLAIMRNPLAEPGVLGINSGAAAAAMAVIVLVEDPPVALLQAAGFFGAASPGAAAHPRFGSS